jgi:hypothetical protein
VGEVLRIGDIANAFSRLFGTGSVGKTPLREFEMSATFLTFYPCRFQIPALRAWIPENYRAENKEFISSGSLEL